MNGHDDRLIYVHLIYKQDDKDTLLLLPVKDGWTLKELLDEAEALAHAHRELHTVTIRVRGNHDLQNIRT